MTKEELTKENGRLQSRVYALEREDELNRKELSSILGSFEIKNDYGYSNPKRELKTLSWFEISAQIGKLLEKRDQLGLANMVNDINLHFQVLEEEFRRERKEN